MAKKNEQFIRQDAYSYDSGLTLDLINTVRALLSAAVRGHSSANAENYNFFSELVPGAIVLAVTALELHLNYLIVGDGTKTDKEIRELLDENIGRKVDRLQELFGTRCRGRADLEMVIEIRNEIAHHFPRPGNAPENLPKWFSEVESRGLLMSTGKAVDYNLGQKLGSFRLVVWVCTVIAGVVRDLVEGSSHLTAQLHPFDKSNFPSLLGPWAS